MIIRIKKIDNLGIFKGHKQSPEFKRFTLIYGWNGSGKTTFSRLFTALSSGSHKNYPNLKYDIDSTEGSFNQTKTYPRKIMVFNKEYIEENAPSLEDPALPSKHIFVLGKEDKTLAKSIEDNKKELDSIGLLLAHNDPKKGIISLKKQLQDKETEYEDLFTNTARSIASLRSGDAVRQYNRTQALQEFKKLTQKQELDPTDEQNKRILLREELLDEVAELDVGKFEQEKKNLKNLVDKAHATLKTTIQQTVVKRLEENPDIAEWVGLGLKIHKKHKSKHCEYCQQVIPSARINELANHFNDSHDELVREIDDIISGLQKSWSIVNSFNLVDKTAFYKDMQSEYQKKQKEFEGAKTDLLGEIQKLGELLKSKKLQTNKMLSTEIDLDTGVFESALEAINLIIRKHNTRSKNFGEEREKAFKNLEKHYLSSIFDKAKNLEKDIKRLKDDIKNDETKIEKLKIQISEEESKLRNTKDGCDALNKGLADLLGRNELIFEDGDLGYTIRRNGEIAKDLSEGEKTAIAFIYFLTHLNNKDFNLKEGIVVIDDPISSLDIDAIYRISGLIKSKLKKSHQLIIMTHNYEFFNQIKSWFIVDPDIDFKNRFGNGIQGAMLMIKNPFNKTKTTRIAEIKELDPLLRDYESEYHYLFDKLLSFEEDLTEKDDGTIEAVYHYPNIGRKTLECFLSFRVPETGSFYTKLKKLRRFNKEKISEDELEDIYSFVNSNSHLDTKTGLIQFDPILGKNGKKYIQMVLDLIKKSDEDHYKSMSNLVGRN